MAREGAWAERVPPRGRPRSKRDWDGLCRKAQDRPGIPLLAASDVPVSLATSVRERSRPPFVTDEGRLLVQVRNSEIRHDRDGKRYGDLWFTWLPNKEGKSE